MNWLFLTTLLVAVLSVARTARLLVFDDYPPMQWVRHQFDEALHYYPHEAGWGKILHCAFCATPYLALGMAIWFLSVQPWTNPADYWSADWWFTVVNGTWGLSYVAAMLVAYDQPEG